MPAIVTPLPPPARPQDPAAQAALAELLQLGLAVARVAARLAEVENAALDALADAAPRAAQALAAHPASLADAIRTGREADAMDAARDAVAARVASIAESFEKAARAVRRTVALQARLADNRPFAPLGKRGPGSVPAPGSVTPGRPAARRPDNDTERAERPDTPEHGDELGNRTDDDVLRAIHRDLAGSALALSAAAPDRTRAAPAPDRTRAAPAPATPPPHPAPAPTPAPARPDPLPPPDP